MERKQLGRVVEGLNGEAAARRPTDFDPSGSAASSVDGELQKALE